MTGNLRLGFHAPATSREISDLVAEAAHAKIPLEVRGRGSKYEVGRFMQSGSVVSTEQLVGISLYEPSELVLSAASGTPRTGCTRSGAILSRCSTSGAARRW